METIRLPGRINSLAQTLMKHTAPGVPDLYQGAELWDLSLVDPDNRRPVDYKLRCRLLHEIETLSAAQVMERIDEGLPKLWTIHHALDLRRRHPEWFGAESAYQPLEAVGSKRGPRHRVSARRDVSSPSFRGSASRSGRRWGDTAVTLPAGEWRNLLSGADRRGRQGRSGGAAARLPHGAAGPGGICRRRGWERPRCMSSRCGRRRQRRSR